MRCVLYIRSNNNLQAISTFPISRSKVSVNADYCIIVVESGLIAAAALNKCHTVWKIPIRVSAYFRYGAHSNLLPCMQTQIRKEKFRSNAWVTKIQLAQTPKSLHPPDANINRNCILGFEHFTLNSPLPSESCDATSSVGKQTKHQKNKKFWPRIRGL